MDIAFIIDTIHERRAGIDLIAAPYEARTVYANPDPQPKSARRARLDAAQRALLPDEPDVEYDVELPEVGHSDRDLTQRADRDDPDQKPVEERMSIVSNRVQTLDPDNNTTHRLESGLEDKAFTMLKARRGVVKITTQFGPVWYQVNGEWCFTFIDLHVEHEDGFCLLVPIRHSEAEEEVNEVVELISNQTLGKYGHAIEVWTEKKITPAAVYRAERILRAREVNVAANNLSVLKTLLEVGGRARLGEVRMKAQGMTMSQAADAVWSLIDAGVVAHDHPNADALILKNQSWIRIVEKA